MSDTDGSTKTVSKRFSALDADLTIKSSDGVLFKVHRRNLELLSEGFPGEDVKTHNEIVELTETADTLELLFQYMYRQLQPDLHGIPFQTLASLAEAAEKYQVFPAMEVCKIYMRAAIPAHPMEVLAYAARHGYANMCDEAAPKTVLTSPRDAVTRLNLTTFVRWVLYREHWMDILHRLHTVRPPLVYHRGGRSTCEKWTVFQTNIKSSFGSNPGALMEIEDRFYGENSSLSECKHCTIRSNNWERETLERIRYIPKFSAMLPS